MTVTLRYFAWMRERIGRSEERLDVPAEVTTIAELVTWLKAKGPEYAHVPRHAAIAGAREIAFFPPVTGG
jgi:molybdopterin synthase sulfur carrier subunit